MFGPSHCALHMHVTAIFSVALTLVKRLVTNLWMEVLAVSPLSASSLLVHAMLEEFKANIRVGKRTSNTLFTIFTFSLPVVSAYGFLGCSLVVIALVLV